MVETKISFLIECDNDLNIIKTLWYQPAYLISPFDKNFLDLFVVEDQVKIQDLIGSSSLIKTNQVLETSYQLKSLQSRVFLLILSKDDKLLIHGQEPSILGQGYDSLAMTDVLMNFMMLILKKMDKDFSQENERAIQAQFEQIQKLNNNLINTQRELKKTNAKLNQVNKDLNNRLVKDALTGLVSRYQYRQEIEYTILKSPQKQGVYCFIDIDDFKLINDSYGHGTGDQFLRGFANRLKKLPYENIICMRIAGDEFGIYIHDYKEVNNNDLEDIWLNFKKHVLENPILIQDKKLEVMCSVGMSVYGRDTLDVFDLIEYADIAMYQAKKSGKNSYRVFDKKSYKEKEGHSF